MIIKALILSTLNTCAAVPIIVNLQVKPTFSDETAGKVIDCAPLVNAGTIK